MSNDTRQPMTGSASPQAQRERREALYARHRETLGRVDRLIDTPLSQRARMWHALPWLADPSADAEAIERFIIGEESWAHCAFSPTVCLQLLLRHAERMTEGLRTHLEDYAGEALEKEAPKRFAGLNDNFPAMAACCLALAGRYFDEPKRNEQAAEVLRSSIDLLRRRDYLSEYLSTTYSPITLSMFAEIAEHAASAELREMGARLEARLWRELLSHWHVASASLAGPHARSYERDSLGHIHSLHHVLWVCFGEGGAPINPHDQLYPEAPPQMRIHNASIDFVRCNGLWQATATYHPDERAMAYLREPHLPRTEIGTAESAPFRDQVPKEAGFDPPGHGFPYPAAVARVVSHLSEHVTVGTASRDFLDGNQNDAFIVKASTAHRAPSPQPPRTLFTRFVSGGKAPGESNHYPDMKKDGRQWMLIEEGRRHGIQHENAALVLYTPKRRLAMASTGRLSLNVLIGCHFSRIEELRIGDQQVGDEPITAEHPEPVFAREGESYIALLPTTVSDLGREHAMWAGPRGPYLVVEWINYAGPERAFTEAELLGTRNGFAAVVEEAGARSFDSWCAQIARRAAIADESPGGDLRRAELRFDDTRLATKLNPATESIQYDSVNGDAVDTAPTGATR